MKSHSLHRRASNRRGAALIVILAFVVLLTGMVVAYLSRSLSERQIANTSANDGKAETFAQGALQSIVGDLKQEIVAGSSNALIRTGPVSATLYFPSTAQAMVPARVATADTLANLVKRSASGQPFYSGTPYATTGSSRAVAVSSTEASLNSRTVTLARWNLPLLLPKKTSGQTANLTPVADFSAPDWIYVDRSGGNPTAVSQDAVGRYAYCIYDEGGLLDINVAGYPSSIGASVASRKMGTCFADLSKVGLTSTQADALILWRNYATLGGSISSGSSAYFNYVVGNGNGFLATSSTAVLSGQSDQMFVSRQQLLHYLLKAIASGSTEKAALQDALQYLGTFSRSLEQPSFAPASTRPLVVGYAAAPSIAFGATVASSVFGTDAGGNDAYRYDDDINPSFLKVRVTAAFARNDGTPAAVGEPLVFKRFALNRLAWLTYAGPSQSRNYASPAATGSNADLYLLENSYGISKEFLAQGTSGTDGAIYKYFGLTWDAANQCWLYDHGLTSGDATAIGKLSDVSGIREPDFAELLKAGLAVGSLAKGAATNHERGNPTFPDLADVAQYNTDTSVNYHVIQILANIIDQFDCDGYPTHIRYAGKDFYGVENLAYLLRARAIGVNTSGNTGAMLLLPEIWNPHDPRGFGTGPAPSSFRFVVAGPSVLAAGRTRVYPGSGSAQGATAVSNYGVSVSLDTVASGTVFSAGVTELGFSIPAGSSAASSPVFLGNLKGSSQANGISLSVGSRNLVRGTGLADADGFLKDTVTQLSYCGVLLGQFPTMWTTASGTAYPLVDAATSPFRYNPSSADMCQTNSNKLVDYVLQYKDAAGAWRTYQDNYSILPRIAGVSVQKKSGANSGTYYIDISGGLSVCIKDTQEWLGWMDPRTSRFGAFYNTSARDTNPITLSNSNYYGATLRPGTDFGQAFMFCVPGSGLQTDARQSPNATRIGWYPGGWTSSCSDASQLFAPGYYAENVTGNRPPPQGNANFFTDPDGVVRRGMSAYVPATPSVTTGMPMAGQTQSRPVILNRPFRSVSELGAVFSGTPWRNLDFFTPESGCASLLDVLCINETQGTEAMCAGKVSLNTRQGKVIQAVLSGYNGATAYKDEWNTGSSGLSNDEISRIATALLQRTTGAAASGSGPLCNLAELVGKWNSKVTVASAQPPHNIDGSQSYTGFSSDLTAIFDATDGTYSTSRVQRLRESAVRALSCAGQTRVWNLMIDVVAQTGRFRPGETALKNFVVQGERRYWLHVAIDRLTGEVIDKQLELVKE